MSKEKILNEYDIFLPLADEYAQSMETLISVLLSSSNIHTHSITKRVKERISLSKKVESKNKYSSLKDITDIIGIRIISLYSDDVDKIAEVITKEFLIDEDNSIDKGATLDPDRFGYLSLHYVLSINKDREKLVEYKQFSGLKFEIQIRSILQHTWAEIEHDIGYKSKVEIPRNIRRQFSRLAGLLELADNEFKNIKENLLIYEKIVEETIDKFPEKIDIDTISVFEFVNNNKELEKISQKVADVANFSSLENIDKDSASQHTKYLKYFEIKTISELSEIINLNEKNILLRANDVDGEGNSTNKGIAMFYLYQVLAGKQKDKNKILDFLTNMNLSSDKDDFADYLQKLAQKFV